MFGRWRLDASGACRLSLDREFNRWPFRGHFARALARSITTAALALFQIVTACRIVGGSSVWRALRGRSMVVLQEAAQTLSADDAVVASLLKASGEDQHVAQALMIALMVIMRDELGDRSS
jgi:hypothetical protein